jgi:hypothetical protein
MEVSNSFINGTETTQGLFAVSSVMKCDDRMVHSFTMTHNTIYRRKEDEIYAMFIIQSTGTSNLTVSDNTFINFEQKLKRAYFEISNTGACPQEGTHTVKLTDNYFEGNGENRATGNAYV